MNSINSKLKNSESRLCTEEALKASKSSADRGFECEDIALKYYQTRGFEGLHRRLKTPFAEVDLLLKSPANIPVIVEVKSLKRVDDIAWRIRPAQMKRLRKAAEYIAQRYGVCELHLAFVTPSGDVQVLTEF